MQVVTVYWRDIPSQIIVKKGRQRAKCKLPDLFQQAVHRAAMRAGKGGSAEYLEDWRRETVTATSKLGMQQLADEEAEKLASAFDSDRLEALVKSKGFLSSNHSDISNQIDSDD